MKDNYATLFISGVIVWFYIHIIINIGMNLGVSPVTGIPLPFMSYGGSHLLLESISTYRQQSNVWFDFTRFHCRSRNRRNESGTPRSKKAAPYLVAAH